MSGSGIPYLAIAAKARLVTSLSAAVLVSKQRWPFPSSRFGEGMPRLANRPRICPSRLMQ